jgi:tRNA U34 5-carboxymethylaminomethyl modifying GTPase MnmE/TrmE
MSAVKDAHVVLWVTSAAEPFGEGEREGIIGVYPGNVPRETIVGVDDNRPVLVVINKIDLIESNYINAIQNVPRGTLLDEKKQFCDDHALKYIETSLTEKINTDELFNAIKSAIHNVSNDICTPEIIVNQRHHNIIASIVSELQECLAHFDREEISAHYLKKALDLLAEFLGHVAGDEVLNEIFGKFCIGK